MAEHDRDAQPKFGVKSTISGLGGRRTFKRDPDGTQGTGYIPETGDGDWIGSSKQKTQKSNWIGRLRRNGN